MLPKDVLKYAEKVKDVDAAVVDALKKREKAPALDRSSPFYVPTPPTPGQILNQQQMAQMQQQYQAAQQQYVADVQAANSLLGNLGWIRPT